MRLEAEILLGVIGDYLEVGTHASIPKYLALAYSINAGEDHYSLSKGDHLDKDNYRQAVIELTPYFDQMSKPAFSRLMSFVHVVGFSNERDFGEELKKGHPFPAYCDEQIGKRGEFLRSFSHLKPPLWTYEDLKREKKLRERFPWGWIDTVCDVNLSAGRDEIVSHVVSSGSVEHLCYRVPVFVRARPKGVEQLDYILGALRGKIPGEEFDKLSLEISNAKG
jgi:hypothetical protein